MKKIYLILGFLLVFVTVVTATQVKFFYSESCPHCQKIFPIVEEFEKYFNLDVEYIEASSIPDYNEPVPKFIITTDDGREISFVGADERRLFCEVQEMTTKECPTYSADSSMGGSWFVS